MDLLYSMLDVKVRPYHEHWVLRCHYCCFLAHAIYRVFSDLLLFIW